jgi:hypothetical protein
VGTFLVVRSPLRARLGFVNLRWLLGLFIAANLSDYAVALRKWLFRQIRTLAHAVAAKARQFALVVLTAYVLVRAIRGGEIKQILLALLLGFAVFLLLAPKPQLAIGS